MRKFNISCGSTVDLPYAYMLKRDIPVIFYSYTVDETEYSDDMGRDPEALPRFYGMLAEGKLPKTSQVNMAKYVDFFEEQLKNGDLLHIAFGSGMSNSVENAFAAAEMLKEKFPEFSERADKLLTLSALKREKLLLMTRRRQICATKAAL